MSQLKVVFAGTPAFALPSLQALHQAGHDILAVYTQPDRPAGRGQKPSPSIIKTWAEDHSIPVFQPETLKDVAEQEKLAALKPDIMVVVAYGLILPKAVLDLPRFGCINVHASLLPRWRGAAPVQYAIASGDTQTGVSIMQLDIGMDTGPVLAQSTTPIHACDTSATLLERLALIAQEPLLSCIDNIQKGLSLPQAQNDKLATYAHKIHKTDAKINWQLSAVELDRTIRAYQPWPIAYTELNAQDVKIHQARIHKQAHHATPGEIIAIDKQAVYVACAQDVLAIEIWQWPNAKKMSVATFLNGHAHNIQLGQVCKS